MLDIYFYKSASVVIPGKPFRHLKNTLFLLLLIVDALCTGSCHVLAPRESRLPFVGFGAFILALRGTIFTPREHPGGPFWHLGTTLEDCGEQQDGLEVVVYRILLGLG